MRILHTVEFYEPRRGGAEEVIKQLSERMVLHGHEVTVATTYHPSRTSGYIQGVRIEQFRLSGNAAKGIRGDKEEVRRYQDLLTQGFDVVVNYAAQNWPTDLALDVLYRITAKKVLVPCGYSGLHNPLYAAYFAQLPEKLKQYDALVYMSFDYQDKQFGDEHGVRDKAVYIPNGAGEEFVELPMYNFKYKLDIQTPYVALCVSNHYLAKGHRFVIEAFRAMNRKDTTLVIIGKPLVSSGIKRTLGHFVLDYCRCFWSSLTKKNIRLVSTDDRRLILSAYAAADVFLSGSSVECAPLVMYESFASKTPFITRPAGNVADHKEVLKIVETPAEMARVANYILDDSETARDIAERAFLVWQKSHTWKSIVLQYEQLYKRICNRA